MPPVAERNVGALSIAFGQVCNYWRGVAGRLVARGLLGAQDRRAA